MILIKELSNISHLFHNCEELKEIFFFDNRIFIDDETSLKSEEYTDNDIYFDFNENINNNSYYNLYNNLGTNKFFLSILIVLYQQLRQIRKKILIKRL